MGKRTYQRLKALACFPEVVDRIKRGDTPTDVAQFIQGESHEYTDIKAQSLAKIVGDYARQNHPDVVHDRKIAKKLAELSEFKDEQVDVLQRLSVLADVQEQRVAINVNAELSGQRLIKGTRDEIKTYVEILGKIGERQDAIKGLGKNIGTMHHVHSVQGPASIEKPEPKQLTESLNDPGRRHLLLETISQAQKVSRAVEGDPDIVDAEYEDVEDADYEDYEDEDLEAAVGY